jgi:hypothetical protein
MMIRLLGAATLAVAGIVGAATAQEAATLAKAPSSARGPELLSWVVQHTHVKPGAKGTGALGPDGLAPEQIGWSSWYNASDCGWYIDSSGNQWFFIYPSQGGIIYEYNDLAIGQALAVPCPPGNWIRYYYTGQSPYSFNQTEALDYN